MEKRVTTIGNLQIDFQNWKKKKKEKKKQLVRKEKGLDFHSTFSTRKKKF